MLRPELVPGLLNLMQLKREIVLASRVTDEHVVRVYDIGKARGKPLIAMDWVDGENLAALLRRVRTLPPSQVYGFAVQICQALRAIHGANVIHRDLKPANLLIRSDGAILVSDFGMACSVIPHDFALGSPGEIWGTPRYMAPERLAGLPADERSDIYSLGLVLLEMLTGTTTPETLDPLRLRLLDTRDDKHLRSVELRHLAVLHVVIGHCICRDRTARCPSADAVLEDLKLFCDEAISPIPHMAPERNWRRFGPRKLWIGLCGTILAVSLAGYLASRRHTAVKAGESEPSYFQALGLLTDQSGEPELRTALDLLGRVTSDSPSHGSVIRAQLETLIRLAERTRTPEWLVQARAVLKSDAAARMSDQERALFQARVDFDAGLLPEVLKAFQAHPALFASSEDAELLLGRTLAGTGQSESALTHYRAVIRVDPESWRAHNDLGSALLELGEVAASAQAFLRVTRLKPDAPTGYSNLGCALLDSGDLAGARKNFELALQHGGASSAYYGLGVVAYYSREYATSIPFFDAAIKLRNSNIYLGALADSLRHLHRTQRDQDTYAQALTLLGQLAQGRPLSTIEQCQRAIYLARLGDLNAATSALDAIAPDTASQDLAYARGIVALLEGRTDAARVHLKAAVRAGYPSVLIDMDPDLDIVHQK
jgi:Flp pilus assembly protein TadD